MLCERQDEREREFQRYGTEAEASAIAARLTFVGCKSRVQRIDEREALTAEVLLAKLEGVKPTGMGHWLARCPAHDDRHPSLAVRELDDGRVLVHDFAGCSAGDVLAAVGLEFDALSQSDRLIIASSPVRSPWDATDALRALCTEITIVAIYAADLRAGRSLITVVTSASCVRTARSRRRRGTAMATSEGRSHCEMANEIFS